MLLAILIICLVTTVCTNASFFLDVMPCTAVRTADHVLFSYIGCT